MLESGGDSVSAAITRLKVYAANPATGSGLVDRRQQYCTVEERHQRSRIANPSLQNSARSDRRGPDLLPIYGFKSVQEFKNQMSTRMQVQLSSNSVEAHSIYGLQELAAAQNAKTQQEGHNHGMKKQQRARNNWSVQSMTDNHIR